MNPLLNLLLNSLMGNMGGMNTNPLMNLFNGNMQQNPFMNMFMGGNPNNMMNNMQPFMNPYMMNNQFDYPSHSKHGKRRR